MRNFINYITFVNSTTSMETCTIGIKHRFTLLSKYIFIYTKAIYIYIYNINSYSYSHAV